VAQQCSHPFRVGVAALRIRPCARAELSGRYAASGRAPVGRRRCGGATRRLERHWRSRLRDRHDLVTSPFANMTSNVRAPICGRPHPSARVVGAWASDWMLPDFQLRKRRPRRQARRRPRAAPVMALGRDRVPDSRPLRPAAPRSRAGRARPRAFACRCPLPWITSQSSKDGPASARGRDLSRSRCSRLANVMPAG